MRCANAWRDALLRGASDVLLATSREPLRVRGEQACQVLPARCRTAKAGGRGPSSLGGGPAFRRARAPAAAGVRADRAAISPPSPRSARVSTASRLRWNSPPPRRSLSIGRGDQRHAAATASSSSRAEAALRCSASKRFARRSTGPTGCSTTTSDAFDRLSIFAGGFSLDGVEGRGRWRDRRFAAVDTAVGARHAPLVVADSTAATTRYRLLETTRAFALDKLADSGEFRLPSPAATRPIFARSHRCARRGSASEEGWWAG